MTLDPNQPPGPPYDGGSAVPGQRMNGPHSGSYPTLPSGPEGLPGRGQPGTGEFPAPEVGEGPVSMSAPPAGPAGTASRLVRPYAVTRGRTRPKVEIALEALVSTTPAADAQRGTLGPERQSIAEMCERVLSLAEIAALLRMPLGVARVLVGDMAADGLVQVHEPGKIDNEVGVYLLERVLSGLRKL